MVKEKNSLGSVQMVRFSKEIESEAQMLNDIEYLALENKRSISSQIKYMLMEWFEQRK